MPTPKFAVNRRVAAVLVLLAGSAALIGARSRGPEPDDEDAERLNWSDLLPVSLPSTVLPTPASHADGLAGSEAPWLSKREAQRDAPVVVQALNGKRIEIDGYVVPLEFEITSVKSFLLVPFVGACIHVPSPPPNQIIYVKLATAMDVSRTFAPVTVRGIIRTIAATTGLANAGYSLKAERISERNPCRAFGCRRG